MKRLLIAITFMTAALSSCGDLYLVAPAPLATRITIQGDESCSNITFSVPKEQEGMFTTRDLPTSAGINKNGEYQYGAFYGLPRKTLTTVNITATCWDANKKAVSTAILPYTLTALSPDSDVPHYILTVNNQTMTVTK